MQVNYRRCVSCQKTAHKSSLWRVIRIHSSHQIQLDQGMGRSAYICPQPECLQLARLKKRLERSLKTKIPESIYQDLHRRLEEKY